MHPGPLNIYLRELVLGPRFRLAILRQRSLDIVPAMQDDGHLLATHGPLVLGVELVPETCWGSNVRKLLEDDPAAWGRIRRVVLAAAGSKCEVCREQGRLECHEVWDYDDGAHDQRLVRMIALCPACHEVKHIGRARVKGRGPIAMRHLSHTNGWSEAETDIHVQAARALWRERSKYQWSLNLDALAQFGINVGTLTAAARPPASTDLHSGRRQED